MSFPWANHYQPKNGLMLWLDEKLPLPRFVYNAVGAGYPVPRNLNYFWNFGVLAGFCLVLQIVTGVSTGGVQALFVAINDRAAYERLVSAYTIEDESEVVDRHRLRALAVLTGSMAGLAPLRNRIEEALCDGLDKNAPCPMIARLAGVPRNVYIGFVEARTGKFVYADVRAFAEAGSRPGAGDDEMINAQQCLTAVAMASAAMPAFYQQVRIEGSTYFDGGVRKSVFEAGVATALLRAMEERRSVEGQPTKERDLFVIRNGPTMMVDARGQPKSDPAADKRLNAIDAALRAEAIVVNELEIGAIAAIRLSHPSARLYLATADGYSTWKFPSGQIGCPKSATAMFDPDFMKCLRQLGRIKADRERAWIELGTVGLSKPAKGIP